MGKLPTDAAQADEHEATLASHLITDLAPYRARAAQLVADIIAGKVTAAEEATALLAKLHEQVVRPLEAALEAVPLTERGSRRLDDVRQRDAIGEVVYA